jgi:hypothetical protein
MANFIENSDDMRGGGDKELKEKVEEKMGRYNN